MQLNPLDYQKKGKQLLNEGDEFSTEDLTILVYFLVHVQVSGYS